MTQRRLQIVSPLDLHARVKRLYELGLPPGDSTGWSNLDPFYTVATKQWTLVTGIPGSGKSEWVDAVMVNLARRGDWTFAIYSPENHPIEMHVAKLAEKYIGKPFAPGPTERMTQRELDVAQNWVHEFFMWLEPDYRDHASLLEAAEPFRCANKKFGVVLDPWNTLEHKRPPRFSETEYISFALTDCTNWVRRNDAHLWVVAHPQKMIREGNGKRPVPTPYDIAGSANWFNKADNIIAIHRVDDDPAKAFQVQVHIQKIRFKNIGKVGGVLLRYNRITGQYSELFDSFVVG